jgi:hypothetical protein
MAVSYKWFGSYPKSGHSYTKAYDARLFGTARLCN